MVFYCRILCTLSAIICLLLRAESKESRQRLIGVVRGMIIATRGGSNLRRNGRWYYKYNLKMVSSDDVSVTNAGRGRGK